MRIDYQKLIIIVLFLILVYTRFVNLSWGLPYPMHPDERNMAVAISQLSCPQLLSSDCLNPHFFAYGQIPLYISYFGIMFFHSIFGLLGNPVTYSEAVIALRIISAISSVLMVWFLVKIFQQISSKNKIEYFPLYVTTALFIFSPGLIQFAHFGTTESLLMFFYVLLLYVSMQFLQKSFSYYKYMVLASLIVGAAVATKISSLTFLTVPFFSLAVHVVETEYPRKLLRLCFAMVHVLLLALIFSILFSPYNFIQFSDFLGSISYESDIATGKYVAFYIRQFVATMPVLFQFTYIFPYVLGWGVIVLFILGFLFLPFNRRVNLLRIAFLSYFFPTAFLFSKWSRFMSPIFPIMLLIATLFLFKIYSWLKNRWLTVSPILNIIFFIIALLLSLRGIAYLSIYTRPDVRFTASDWVFKNLPSNAYIFSETANVVDIPITAPSYPENYYADKTYKYISFNLYDLDSNFALQNDMQKDLEKANYIFIPSRRIFMNHTCYNEHLTLQKQNVINNCAVKAENYHTLNVYYDSLFSGELGFEKVAEFSSYPSISIFGKKFIEYPDEAAEESWTVFDHPVIRIFKRT